MRILTTIVYFTSKFEFDMISPSYILRQRGSEAIADQAGWWQSDEPHLLAGQGEQPLGREIERHGRVVTTTEHTSSDMHPPHKITINHKKYLQIFNWPVQNKQ